MMDPKPMSRGAITLAGWLILGAAVAGLGLGLSRNPKGHSGIDSETGEVVSPIKTVANATPLVAPPVTEADVRRWAREEMQATAAAHARKAETKADGDQPDADTTDTGVPAAITPLSPSTSAKPVTATPPVKPAANGQIPF